MEIFYTTQTDLPAGELAEKLSQLRPDIEKTNVNIIGTGCYENVLDFLLFQCRTAGLFKERPQLIMNCRYCRCLCPFTKFSNVPTPFFLLRKI